MYVNIFGAKQGSWVPFCSIKEKTVLLVANHMSQPIRDRVANMIVLHDTTAK